MPTLHTPEHCRDRSWGSKKADYRTKLAKAKQAVCPLAGSVLRKPEIDWTARRHVLESIGISAATHNTGIWHCNTAEEARTWDSGVVDLYKLLLRADGHTGHPAFPCMPSVSGATGFPTPAMLLVKQRLLHVCRIVTQQRDLLWTYLAGIDEISPNSWLQCIREDLRLVASFTEPFSAAIPLRHDGPAADALYIWLSEHCHAIRRRVRAACANQAAGLWQYAQFQYNARALGIRPARAAPTEQKDWRFHLCSFAGNSYNALGAHLHAAHQHKCHARAFAAGTICRMCLTQFWTQNRLVRHLAHSGSQCLLRMLCDEVPAEATQVPSEVCLANLPAVRLHGPLRKAETLDQACIASMLAEESPAFAQLVLPSICRFLPELEGLAAANAFPQRDRAAVQLGHTNRCPTGRELIRSYLQ